MKFIWLTDVESKRRYFVNLRYFSHTNQAEGEDRDGLCYFCTSDGPAILIDQAQMDAVEAVVVPEAGAGHCATCEHEGTSLVHDPCFKCVYAYPIKLQSLWRPKP